MGQTDCGVDVTNASEAGANPGFSRGVHWLIVSFAGVLCWVLIAGLVYLIIG
jgi:hypothetical protein